MVRRSHWATAACMVMASSPVALVSGAFNLAATTREVPADGARVVPTFRVERAPPAGHSHARTVAHDNGLLFEQIIDS